jgi:predicted ferric reductase
MSDLLVRQSARTWFGGAVLMIIFTIIGVIWSIALICGYFYSANIIYKHLTDFDERESHTRNCQCNKKKDGKP